MASYTHRESADMHLVYGMANCNGREALRIYREKYLSRKMPSHSFFVTIHQKLCETGSLDVHKPNAGRQRISRTVDAEERVVQALQYNPSTSIRVVPRENHISKLPSGAKYTMKDFTLIIYKASRHFNRETIAVVWILCGVICKERLSTDISLKVFYLRMRAHSH